MQEEWWPTKLRRMLVVAALTPTILAIGALTLGALSTQLSAWNAISLTLLFTAWAAYRWVRYWRRGALIDPATYGLGRIGVLIVAVMFTLVTVAWIVQGLVEPSLRIVSWFATVVWTFIAAWGWSRYINSHRSQG